MDESFMTIINGFNQVGIIVKDLHEAIRQYATWFRIRNWQIYTYDNNIVKEMKYLGKNSSYAMRIALSNDIENTQIELIEPLKGPSIYHDFIETTGYGFHHFGVHCDDVEKTKKDLIMAGFRILQEGKNFCPAGDGHFAYIDLRGVLGFIVELRQPPTDRWPPESTITEADFFDKEK